MLAGRRKTARRRVENGPDGRATGARVDRAAPVPDNPPPFRSHDEENFPAQQSTAQENARIPRPDADEERPRGLGPPPGQGAQASDGLSLPGPRKAPEGRHGAPASSAQGAPTDFRIRRRAEYEKVYALGRKFYGRFMILFCAPRTELPARFGLAVSRKVGGAVIRNRVKRRLREICRKELVGGPPADFVLSLRREAAAAGLEELRAEVVRLARKALGGR